MSKSYRNDKERSNYPLRNPYVEAAGRRQKSAGGFHSDDRERRQNRNSWKRELDLDDYDNLT